jgi:hypothetical protein
MLPSGRFASFSWYAYHSFFEYATSVGGDFSEWFISPFETLAIREAYCRAASAGGEEIPAMQQPWPIGGIFDDFMVVTAAPLSDTYEIAFRQNETTIFTLPFGGGSGRVFRPSGSPAVTVRPFDRLCWQAVNGGSSACDAQLLWTFRPSNALPGGFDLQGFNQPGFGGGGPV